MQEKYGEEFVGISYNLAEILKEYDEFFVYPKSKGQEGWTKVVGDYEKGEYVLIDGYFGQLIEDRYYQYLDKIFSKYLNRYYFTIRIERDRAYSSKLTKDIPIEEIANNMDEGWNFSPYIDLAISSSELEEVSETELWKLGNKLGEACLESNLYLSVYLRVIKEDKFEDYVRNNGDIMHGISEDDYYGKMDEYRSLEEEREKEYFAYFDEYGQYRYNIVIGLNDDEGKEPSTLSLYVDNTKVKERDINE
ncbi:MAG: hypothetical protein Q3993_08925, partial [Filifactor alocis]|nr:hypothetical protein [Filifactor alocis]